ncbi:Tir-nbs resistance protein [Quillaja saponaria]|uniref:Tir-nbs resistance protein n=1 Tax=Quillaja saponaria TaxID=32244 RepID=A0AAD7M2Y0_QUISA|nr:Tir-nbs resistance protein [Quillaja saponaria]KAJ7969006.1 Tir-nbs resistance protein [Quillaja saponaria]
MDMVLVNEGSTCIEQDPSSTTDTITSNGLTIKIAANCCSNKLPGKFTSSSAIDGSNSVESSAYNSPSLFSPPSSAFVSALQSPYISPRALTPKPPDDSSSMGNPTPITLPSPPVSYRGSQSDDVPSSSYTPPSDPYEFSDDPFDPKLKFVTCVPVPDAAPPRISFSFPVPRISFAKAPVSPSNAKLRSCDVYIGFHGQNPNLLRFCKWLKSELELQGIACFVADRAKYSDCQSHEIADRVICSVTIGLVVVTNSSFLNHLSLEEIRFFSQKKNLIPVFFDTGPAEVTGLLICNSINKECREAIDGLMKFHELKLEATEGNWRSCVSKAAGILRSRLGRKSVAGKDMQVFEELPFPRNKYFVGREKEIMEIESLFFGCGDCVEQDHSMPVIKAETSGQSESLADEESDTVITAKGRYISLEMGKCKEPTSEVWVEPMVGKNSLKRLKCKKSKSGNYKSLGSSVICINGVPGFGKSELALEFAYRYRQRYKMVLWVGGEARYLRQNILNLSASLGLDVSADSERERGRTRSFEEQEFEAFKRVKRELFRDMPYLLIIDNLETEKEWWEGKDLHDLIPRNTGGTHVIITTRLSKVMNFDTIHLPPLPLSDAMLLIRGRKKKDYPAEEIEFLRNFDEKLGRLSFGLWVIGSLLSELAIIPSALFDAINQVPLDEGSPCTYMSIAEEHYCKNNPYLMKILNFCFAILQQKNKGKGSLLATRMFLVGGWFAPSPVSASVLVTAAKNMPNTGNRFKKWTKCLSVACRCCSGCLASQAWKSEEESALVLVKLGLARKANTLAGCWIQFHPITQAFSKRKGGLQCAKAAVQAVRKIGNPFVNLDHLWASAFLVFGFKSEPPLVQLKAIDMVLYVKRTALPLAIQAFTTFSRCNSALELLKVCTNVLEEVEKSFVSQIQDWCHRSLYWKKRLHGNRRVDEYVWQDVTLLKATLLETRAKLLLRGGHFDSGEELCRTCISIRTVMLGHNHGQTLAAQETLAKLVRMRSKI